MQTTRRTFLSTATATTALAAARASKSGAKAPAVKSGANFYVASVTPCDKNRKFDEGLYRDLMPFFKEKGADGVVVLGTTGEFPSFSMAERKRVAETDRKSTRLNSSHEWIS